MKYIYWINYTFTNIYKCEVVYETEKGMCLKNDIFLTSLTIVMKKDIIPEIPLDFDIEKLEKQAYNSGWDGLFVEKIPYDNPQIILDIVKKYRELEAQKESYKADIPNVIYHLKAYIRYYDRLKITSNALNKDLPDIKDFESILNYGNIE